MIKIGIDASVLCQDMDGIKRYLLSLISGLMQEDRKNQYLLFVKEKQGICIDLAPNMSLVELGASGDFYFEKIALLVAIKKYKIDIFYSPKNYGFPLFKLNCKFVLTIHDLIPKLFKVYWKGRKLKERFIYCLSLAHSLFLADRIIVDSKNTLKDLNSCLKVPTRKIFVIYPGLKINNPEITVKARDQIFKKFKIKDNYILVIAGQSSHKNVGLVLKAFELLLEKLDAPLLNLQLVVIGNFKQNGLEETYSKLKNQQSLVETGVVSEEEIDCLYRNAELLAYPSSYEGFGFPILEAMGRGVPVIASLAASIPEVAGDAALYFETGDHFDLCLKIISVLNNAQLKQKLIERGLIRSRIFSESSLAKGFLGVLSGVKN